jgi:hypothetical protein
VLCIPYNAVTMWSDRYYYLNIFHDTELSVHCNTGQLITFLQTLPQLKQTSDYTFTNSSNLSIFLTLSLLYARHKDSWSDKDTDPEKTNLITIVCSKDNEQNFEEHKNIFIQIAAFLNWQLVDERTDDGIEDFVLWAPIRKLD